MRISTKVIFLLVILLIAMLFAKIPYAETFRSGSRCPSALIRSGDKLMLIYDNAPIYFNNLEEYIAFVNELRSQGIDCPVAMLQEENGQLDINAELLDASRDNGKYNKGSYPGFDPYGLHIGRYTDLDKTHDSTANPNLSDNPMDPNWGGVEHTQDMVDSGKYEEREVTKKAYFTPKVQFFPDIKFDNKLQGNRQ